MTVPFILLTFLYVALISYYAYGWMRLKNFSSASYSSVFSTKVSVIIPVRNEESTIAHCLHALFRQDFPKELLEIIVVDDNSTDSTMQQLQWLSNEYPFKIIQLKEDNVTTAFKKKAITTAIEQAIGELIITTDADCSMGERWLSEIVGYYETYKPKMLVAPVGFHKEKTIFEKFQTLEFLTLIGITAAAIRHKMPIMCNGANLAYQRKVFFEVGGFNFVNHIASGDDVFLMLKIAKQNPSDIHFLKSRDAIVYTEAQKTMHAFVQQRKRWASKSTKYKNISIPFIALVIYLFNFSLPICFASALIFRDIELMQLFLFQFFFKVIIDGVFIFSVLPFFKRNDLFSLFLPAQIFYIPYIVIIGTIAPFGQYQWKGRKVS